MNRDDERRSGPDRRESDSGSFPNAWLYQEFVSLRELVTDQHQRLRQDMQNGFAGIRADFKQHEEDDRMVERRVHDIEYREVTAKNTVTKRNMTASGVIAALVGPATAYLFRKWFGG